MDTVVLVHTFKLPDKHYMRSEFADTFYHVIGQALCDILEGGAFYYLTEASDYAQSLDKWLEEIEPAWAKHIRQGLASLAASVAFSMLKSHEDELDYILTDDYSIKTIDYRLCNNYIKVRVRTNFPF